VAKFDFHDKPVDYCTLYYFLCSIRHVLLSSMPFKLDSRSKTTLRSYEVITCRLREITYIVVERFSNSSRAIGLRRLMESHCANFGREYSVHRSIYYCGKNKASPALQATTPVSESRIRIKDYTQQWRQWRPEITTWAAFIDMVHFIFSN
jgi:hypothetical protein